MPQNPLFGGMNMAMMMNLGMGAQFRQAMMEKMKMEMEMRFSQISGHHNAGNNKTKVFGQTKKTAERKKNPT